MGTMKRIINRSKRLLLVVALATAAATSTVSTAYAASPGGGAARINGAAAHATSASSAPCSFVPALTCQSTNHTVTLNIDYYGSQTGCTYAWFVSWGDGGGSSDITVTDPPEGYVFLKSYTYAATGQYTISVTGQVTAGNCTANPFTAQFTLSPPLPPGASPNKCRIDVRATGFLYGHLGFAGNHLWVVYTDMTGAQYHYEALPNPYPYQPNHKGDTVTPNGGTGAQSRVAKMTAGPVTALSGPQACGEDSSGNPVPGFNPNVVTQGPHACFLQQMARIRNAKIPYHPLSTNSNAFVHTILYDCGINPVKPNVSTPGWNYFL